MHGVTVAVDCLTRYNQRIRGDAAALNMFGVLLEREGLLRGAKKALETSLANLNPANESELCTKVRLNLGRVSLKLFSFAAAIEHYAAVAPQTFESLCGFAVANYKEGNYQESYGAYQKALGEAWETGDKSHVLTAMASIAYK
jgi:tetratricopeptide (TPR) repeat protein